jgi:hypothetical protein
LGLGAGMEYSHALLADMRIRALTVYKCGTGSVRKDRREIGRVFTARPYHKEFKNER